MKSGWQLVSGTLVTVLLVVIFGVVSAWATDRYVATTGSDAGDCSNSTSPCKTINYAIGQASAGDTIHVAAGTYVEQVYITKSLTLEGSTSPAKPVIKAPAAASRTTYTIPESRRIFDPIVFANGGSVTIEVTVNNFEIDGNNDGGTNTFCGILFRNTNPGTISNNDLYKLMGTGQETLGIVMYGADTNVTVSGNTVKEFSRNGITANVDAKATITGNTIKGRGYVGVGNWAQNAIQIGFGASGSVTGNTISDIGWIWPGTGTSWAATGVLLYEASGSTVVNNNTMTDVMVGIYFWASAGVANGNNIQMTDADGLDYTAGIVGDPGEAHQVELSPFDQEGMVYSEGIVRALQSTTLTFSFNNNTVIGDGSADGWGIGIWNYSNGAYDVTGMATGNTVQNWDHGFDIDSDGQGSIAATINCNNIKDNNYGVYNQTTTLVDAENNWWGHDSGPGPVGSGSGDPVSTNVDFTPWVRVQVPSGVQCGLGGVTDTDNDGLADTLEMGGDNDQDPSTTTDPLDPDTDNDGLLDGEDENHNGRVDTGETDPNNWDTDGDNLCDGSASLPTGIACTTVSASGRNGEDLDGDETPADRGATETDPTNADTDGDGINDFNDDLPLRRGGGGCFGVAAYSTPTRVIYRPTARRAATRTIVVTIINNSGADLIVPAGAFTRQPDEVFTIVRVSPTLPRTIRNGRRASFSVLTQVPAGHPPVTAYAPYFNINLDCGVVSSAGVKLNPLELEGVQAEMYNSQLRVEAYGAGIASMQVELFDLAGRVVMDQESKGNVLVIALPTGATGKPLAKGVYLYVVTVKGYDGSIQRSEVRKLVLR